ncbi:unnamed protein product [Hymenolepis diminuta]|uniref:Uncharacterized protein n=1 Tax=Hymenolepis diminuta TaxID=6216 RepID=A0A564Z090_HYMDI|nr:unnamed protein product [Hymenolepis diminuta]
MDKYQCFIVLNIFYLVTTAFAQVNNKQLYINTGFNEIATSVSTSSSPSMKTPETTGSSTSKTDSYYLLITAGLHHKQDQEERYRCLKNCNEYNEKAQSSGREQQEGIYKTQLSRCQDRYYGTWRPGFLVVTADSHQAYSREAIE